MTGFLFEKNVDHCPFDIALMQCDWGDWVLFLRKIVIIVHLALLKCNETVVTGYFLGFFLTFFKFACVQV